MHYHYHLLNHYALCPFFNGPDGADEIRQLISFLNQNQINLKLWVTVCRVQLSISYSSLFDPINLSQVNQSEKKNILQGHYLFLLTVLINKMINSVLRNVLPKISLL